MNYKQSQYQRQINVLVSHPELFDYDKGNGYFRNKKYPFVLAKGINNLFEPIRDKDKVLQYFKVNGISWWGGYKPSGHMLSSQMACLNHLFFIREDDNAVLELINNISVLAYIFQKCYRCQSTKIKNTLLLRLSASMTT